MRSISAITAQNFRCGAILGQPRELHAVHVVPVWHEADGGLSYGMEERNPHPPVIGWANILHLTIKGEERLLLAVYEGPADG